VYNIKKMQNSIPQECKWVIVYDQKVKEEDIINVENAIILHSPCTGHYGNPNRNYALEYLKDQLTDKDWLYVLDDDNIIHPDWYNKVCSNLENNSMIHWGQCFSNGAHRVDAPTTPKSGAIDTAQYMVRWNIAKNIRYKELYEADGFYAEDCFNVAGSSLRIEEDLCYFNYLRSNKYKVHDTTRVRICMISMFKNESANIKKMLDSVAPYIDYWVLQDNGSTDGTPDIVKQWAEETQIPGKLYQVEEGWVNFGWNRDHLLQTALKEPHACDWIMKMDCDETLEVDSDFDWSIFWTPHQSFHVTAVTTGMIYFRAWIWNANLPWKFNHDPAHETITLEMDGIGENFHRESLPKSFRMRAGQSHGESYSVPTKYVTDALKLEEKLIREGTMLTDLYHFWYIGKSYEDCYRGNFFPLKDTHQNEYARRCIFYFENILNVTHNYNETRKAKNIDEMAYYAMCGIGNAYRFLKDYKNSVKYYLEAEQFCPRRNDHLLFLAEIHWEMRNYKKMFEYTSIMIGPERTCPFPEFFFLINTNMYHDGGNYVSYLHNVALENLEKIDFEIALVTNVNPRKKLFVVENFYDNPIMVRNFALNVEYQEDLNYYKGKRSKDRYLTDQIKRSFEEILGFQIREWESHGMNGRFQYCTAQDALVYHWDGQSWAGMVYLTPDAPYQTGTSFFAHKQLKTKQEGDYGSEECFNGGFYDKTKFDLVDSVGNVFNRLVLFDAKSIHAASEYFGQTLEDSRLFHLFFFD
jgi:glycosyltransferase involved in cell wall biosynthesis